MNQSDQPTEQKTTLTPLEPPTDLVEVQPQGWETLSPTDPVVGHIVDNLWTRPEQPISWEVARFSSAVYLYRETGTRWTVVAKFFEPKTGSDAEEHAEREMDRILTAQEAGLKGELERTIEPLGTWRGVLFLEHVEGLTLSDVIAVRRSRPGLLAPSLTSVATLLAKLHSGGVRPEETPRFEKRIQDILKYVDQLQRWGVLEDEPSVANGLRRLIDQWAERHSDQRYAPSLIHGDATATNFLFPNDGGVVAIDWERLVVADPAFDLGRLAAEVTHSIREQGGHGNEVAPLRQHLLDSYCHAQPLEIETEPFLERVQFYEASSLLRIARNGWVSRLERTTLVAQAMALLA